MTPLMYPIVLFLLFDCAFVNPVLKQKYAFIKKHLSIKKRAFVYTFQQFKALPAERQVDELGRQGISLDLDRNLHTADAVLYAYRDFYVEMVVAKHTDDILFVNCFRNPALLDPYLKQIDISEIETLLS